LLTKNFPQIQVSDMPTDKKRVRIFSSCEFKELPKLTAKILYIPISNAYAERIFPIMGNSRSFRRNRMIVELVKVKIVNVKKYVSI
jgi:hypothetical protein